MYVAAQQSQAQSLITSGGTAWNLFLMSGSIPTLKANIPFARNSMQGIFANCIAALRVTAVNNSTYGQELLTFEHGSTIAHLKMHGARSTNGVAGIQCMPQAIDSNIAGLNEPAGYVNGLEDGGVLATATTHITTGGWIEYDFGTPCSINRALFGNSSTAARNASNAVIEYFNGTAWVAASANTAVKTYNAAGIDINFSAVEAQRWRIRFLDDTGTTAANTLQYRYLRFFASVLPANVMDKSTTDVTWAMLVPANPTASVYKNVAATELPYYMVSCGGPVDGYVGVLNRRRAGINDIFSLVHLKLSSAVVDEVV